MHLQVCNYWPLAPFFGLPRVRQAGTLASVGGRVVFTGVCSTGVKVNVTGVGGIRSATAVSWSEFQRWLLRLLGRM